MWKQKPSPDSKGKARAKNMWKGFASVVLSGRLLGVKGGDNVCCRWGGSRADAPQRPKEGEEKNTLRH